MQDDKLLTTREEKFAKFLVLLLIKPLAMLPLCLRRFMALCLGHLIASIQFREKYIALLQLKWRLPKINHQKTLRGIFLNFATSAFETLNLTPILKNLDRYVECPNIEIPQNINSRGRPVIALTAHLSNWELMAAFMVKMGVPLTTVGRQARNKFAQYILADLRARYGVDTMWKSDRAGLREMVRKLTPNHTIAALIDQDTHVRSENFEFLGWQAKTPIGLLELGKRFNAIFVTSFIVRDHGKYIIHVEEIPDGLTNDKIIQLYNERLGLLIKKYPEQWVWIHKRWRSGIVENIQLSTKDYIKFLESQIINQN